MINSLDGLRGGLRGIEDDFVGAMDRLGDAWDRVLRAGNAGALPAADSDRLLIQLQQLDQQVGQHEIAASDVTTVADEQAWQARARALIARIDQAVGYVDAAIGTESSRRGLKFGLVVVASMILFGGGAYVLTQKYGKSKRRRRRRRR